MKKQIILTSLLIFAANIFANPFNSKLTEEEKQKLEAGEILIRNIDTAKNTCLNQDYSEKSNLLMAAVKETKPKYLAEVIQYKKYEGNENFEDILAQMLFEVEKFTDIPYTTASGGKYNLYESAEILEKEDEGSDSKLKVRIYMEPFGDIYQDMLISKGENELLYTAKNTNKLRYRDEFDCLGPGKMLTCIYLFKDGDRWVFYSAGGVNAPHIPFFTDRIRRSFMNRINTFCNYIFKKF